MAPTPVLLPGKSHGCRSLVGCSLWGCRIEDTHGDPRSAVCASGGAQPVEEQHPSHWLILALQEDRSVVALPWFCQQGLAFLSCYLTRNETTVHSLLWFLKVGTKPNTLGQLHGTNCLDCQMVSLNT